MRNYHQELRDLQAQAQRRGQLEAQAAELEKEYEEWKKKAFLYEAQMNQEQADVDKLEGRSLSAFFAGLRGNKEERLDKERQEARAARVKYDMAVLERNQAQDQLRRVREELADLAGIPARREELMGQWAQAVKAMGGPAGQAILDLEEKRAWHQGQRREIREALAAGREALEQMDSILASLQEADAFGKWGLSGGGFGVTMEKYDALEEAQKKAEKLQTVLGRFNAALQAVSDEEDLEFLLEDITQFGDYYFQNVYTEQVAQQRLYDTQIKAMVTRDLLQETVDDLAQRNEQQQVRLEELDRALENLLTGELGPRTAV